MWRRVTVLAAIAAVLATFPAPASAGAYRVYSCVAPSGGPAPVADGGYGWQPSGRTGTTSLSLANECGAGRGIAAVLQSAQPYGAGGQWTFQPPPATRIAAFDLTWNGTAAGGGESTISRSDQPDPTYERRYAQDFATERVVEGNVDLTYLTVLVACSFAQPTCSNPSGPIASYRVAESTMTLRDNSAPTAADLGGDLIANPTWRGPMSLTFTARDTGSGVYRVIVDVDGQDALGAVVDANGGHCADADATDTDAHEFLWAAPCRLSVAAQMSIDTGTLPLGAHAVSLALEDAAGNRTPIFGPVAKTIVAPPADRGALNGSPASDAARFTGRRHRTVTTSFKRRRLRVRGRLVGPDGKPIAGARIDVLSQLHRAGARMRAIGSTRTSRKGRFSYKAPPGASRTLRFGYRSHVNDTAFTTTLDVLQRVRASATLRASRHFVPRGGRVTFAGRLRGGYLPPRGKLVELQATDRGRWRTFALVRSSRSGAFRYRYRFSGSGRFAFRARVRFERAYPYVLGYSRRTSVSVG
ncbi:MAG TPA: hypothetical protein VF087_02730 [Solirubrobacteraceae bacterium]